MPLVPDVTTDDLEQLRDASDSAQKRTADFVTEQPVLALGLSFVVGILLGKLIL